MSPDAIWTGHEPCGASGQFTNSVKPYLNFPNPVNGGSFHPNAAGQQTLAALAKDFSLDDLKAALMGARLDRDQQESRMVVLDDRDDK